MGLYLAGHPRPLQGRRMVAPGPERNLYVPVPALFRSHPSIAQWLLTYEHPSGMGAIE